MSVEFGVRRPGSMTVDDAEYPCLDACEGRPALILATANARLVLRALGICDGLSGDVRPDDLIALIGRARAEIPRHRAEFERSPVTSGGRGTGTCRMVSVGYTAEQVLDGLLRLEEIAKSCDPGEVVGWSPWPAGGGG